MVQIVTTSSEINASIIKGFLESAGIKITYGPSGNISMLAAGGGSMGPNQPQNVFVPKEKVEEALKLLKEQGLITS